MIPKIGNYLMPLTFITCLPPGTIKLTKVNPFEFVTAFLYNVPSIVTKTVEAPINCGIFKINGPGTGYWLFI